MIKKKDRKSVKMLADSMMEFANDFCKNDEAEYSAKPFAAMNESEGIILFGCFFSIEKIDGEAVVHDKDSKNIMDWKMYSIKSQKDAD